jgi:hypothetical protein
VRRRNARDLGDDLLDVDLADQLFLPGLRQDPLRGARFVDHIDRLVRKVAVGNKTHRQLDRRGQGCGRVLDSVVGFESRLEPLEDLDRFGARRLADVDLLESP